VVVVDREGKVEGGDTGRSGGGVIDLEVELREVRLAFLSLVGVC
jgi:hypothetical protein